MVVGSNLKEDNVEKIGGNIVFIGPRLEPMEIEIIKKILETHTKRLKEITEYQELKVRLRQHQHGKTFLHEIEVMVIGKGREIRLNSNSSDYNLFAALSVALEKIISQATHKIKK